MAHQQASDEQGPEKQLFLPHHIKIMKVALAIAILRQKPSGVSAQEFTKLLSLQFSQLQKDWKCKAEQLERELLRTRQDLIKCQMHSELFATSQLFPQDPLISSYPPLAAAGATISNFNSLKTASTTINPLCSERQYRLPLSQIQIENHCHSQVYESLSSQDSDCEWQSSGYSSSFPAQKENKSKRLVMSVGGIELEVATSEAEESEPYLVEKGDRRSDKEPRTNNIEDCGGDHKGDVGGSVLQERITAHIQFCTSVSSLSNAGHRLSTLVATDLRETLHDTILDAMRALTECFEPSNCHLSSFLPLSKKVLDEAMSVIVESVQSPRMSIFKDEMITACVSLVKAIIHKALQPATNRDVAETLCSMVLKVCQIPKVCHSTVEVLVQEVINSAGVLKAALSDCCCLTAESIDAAAIEFRMLESLLDMYRISSVIPDDRRRQIIQNLEDSVLELSETFPLFLYSVWKIVGYLS